MAAPISRTDAHTYIGVQLGIAVLLLIALARLPSGYHTFLRWAVCAGAAFNAFALWNTQALRWLGQERIRIRGRQRFIPRRTLLDDRHRHDCD